MDPTADQPMFGLASTNRNDGDHYSKNKFNSSFPAALISYMASRDIPVVVLSLAESSKTDSGFEILASEVKVWEVLGLSSDSSFGEPLNAHFVFEAQIPYSSTEIEVPRWRMPKLDLVVHDKLKELQRGRGFEVKLTVVPDNSTRNLDPTLWGPELVIRPGSLQHCARGMAEIWPSERRSLVVDLLDPVCSGVQHWGNTVEMERRLPDILMALSDYLVKASSGQVPFLLQPIWRTRPNKYRLITEAAFDVFVWTDFALCSAILTQARSDGGDGVSRAARTLTQLTNSIHQLAISNKFDPKAFQENLGNQSDKACSLSGRLVNGYLGKSPRLKTPRIPESALQDLIPLSGELKLQPERRLDQTIKFTAPIRRLDEQVQILAKEARELGNPDLAARIESLSAIFENI